MNREVLLFLAAFSVAALITCAVCPPLEKWVEMTRGTWAIRWSNADKPITRNKVYWVTKLDGFTSEDLADYYEDAAQALAAQSPETASYTWSDNMLFYSRISTLLRFRNGYIEVVASHNNDNDAVSIHFSDQPFTGKDRAHMERIEGFGRLDTLFELGR